jgi:hypothetical protein
MTSIKKEPSVKRLYGSKIAVGHCVILNDAERPCGKHLAVVTSIEGRGIYSKVFCKYLASGRELTSFNKLNDGKGVRSLFKEELTPVGKFGIQVILEKGFYRCERFGASTATYRDGKPRSWQEWETRKYKARPDVLAAAT